MWLLMSEVGLKMGNLLRFMKLEFYTQLTTTNIICVAFVEAPWLFY